VLRQQYSSNPDAFNLIRQGRLFLKMDKKEKLMRIKIIIIIIKEEKKKCRHKESE
jgi:hypothetical protein